MECLLLAALANDGLGKRKEAIEELRQVTAADPNHLAAAFLLDWIEREGKPAIKPEVRPAS